MTTDPRHEVTVLLAAIERGEKDAGERLLPLVYEQLRALARSRLADTPPGNTLQPTALVHEAYLRLIGGYAGDKTDPGWNGRGHFFGAAARAMRDILVEQARRKSAIKAGGDLKRRDLDSNVALPPVSDPASRVIQPPAEDMLKLDSALKRLEVDHPRKAQIVMLKYFAGLEHEQIALALDISVPTVERDWRFARSWLQKEMGPSSSDSPPAGPAGS